MITEYSIPAELKWAPGAVYRWRVQTGDGRAAAAGRFRVLSDAQRARLLDARSDLGGSRLLRAAIYHSFGLNDAALTELRTLRSVQPGNPALQRATMLVQADIRRQRAAGLWIAGGLARPEVPGRVVPATGGGSASPTAAVSRPGGPTLARPSADPATLLRSSTL